MVENLETNLIDLLMIKSCYLYGMMTIKNFMFGNFSTLSYKYNITTTKYNTAFITTIILSQLHAYMYVSRYVRLNYFLIELNFLYNVFCIMKQKIIYKNI